MRSRTARRLVLVLLLMTATASAQGLAIHGDTAVGGSLTVDVAGTPGAPVLLVVGTALLPAPISIAEGKLHLDLAAPWALLTPGAIPAGGLLSLPATLPPDPTLLGALVHCQAAAPGLSGVASLLLHQPDVAVSPGQVGGRYGAQLFVADVDRDGRQDLMIVQQLGNQPTGSLWISYGPDPTPVLQVVDPTPELDGLFGAAVAVLDLTGTADPDLVVGAPGTGALDDGEVWILAGPGFTGGSLLAPPPGLGHGAFGAAMATGDFDGDGDVDLAVGAPLADAPGAAWSGRVIVYDGTTLAVQAELTAPAPQGFMEFGAALAARGDLDGDGRDDLAVGAPGTTLGGVPGAGRVFLFHGPFSAPPVVFDDPHPDVVGGFGSRLALGDVTGDARLDLVVSAPSGNGTPAGNPAGLFAVGEVAVFDGADPGAVVVLDDPTPEAFQRFGQGLALADLDGDGRQDVVVGAGAADVAAQVDAGEALLFLGPHLSAAIALTPPTSSGTGLYAWQLGAVDLDGDGRAGLAVCEVGAALPTTASGAVHLLDF